MVTVLTVLSLVWSGKTTGGTQSWGNPLTRGKHNLLQVCIPTVQLHVSTSVL